MKKKLLIAVVLFALTGLYAFAQNLPTVTIVNQTGYTVWSVYISPSSDDNWGEDRLGADYLYDGDQISITLDIPLAAENIYDICLGDEDGDSYYKWEVRIQNGSVIVFTFDDIDFE
ncbi:hypothetical protein FACS1894151_04330 [Spirochaetia bacterium]|nr:hypothetical protein FACS1894151_04330 [Spirochaetia bacterium]